MDYQLILTYWFDDDQNKLYKTKWFPTDAVQRQTDLEIYEQFNDILQMGLQRKLDDWLTLNIKSNLAYIILLDQFSRHIFRYENLPKESDQRKHADELATNGTDILVKTHSWQSLLTSTEIIFALMPYRHTPTISKLEYIMLVVNNKESLELENLDLLHKFRKQTLTRLQHLQDRAKAEDSDDILERIEFDVDDFPMSQESLTTSTLQFLSSFHKNMNLQDKQYNLNTVVISLSGGVDSMVILRILIYLRKMNPTIVDKIIAIHIDYANRIESIKEADFVESYCHKYNIIFEKRIINEVTRGITDRDEYEKVARDIRYKFYDEILNKYSCRGVVFGHHVGDVQENVISNIMR